GERLGEGVGLSGRVDGCYCWSMLQARAGVYGPSRSSWTGSPSEPKVTISCAAHSVTCGRWASTSSTSSGSNGGSSSASQPESRPEREIPSWGIFLGNHEAKLHKGSRRPP